MGFFVVPVKDRGILKFKIYRRGQACAVFTLDGLMKWMEVMEAKEKRARLG